MSDNKREQERAELYYRNLLEVFSLLSTSNCYYSNGFRAR